MKPLSAGTWRVALIDSCGHHPGALHGAAFVVGDETVSRRKAGADPTGHGSRIAQVLAGEASRVSGPARRERLGDLASEGPVPLLPPPPFELLLGQVFVDRRPASAAAVAAAIDWAVEHRAGLVHLSLGLAADRAVLRAAIERAIDAGCVIVASAPARGPRVFPASYPGVIRGTGDARCAPGELSCLRPWLFGACPRLAEQAGGASIGAARVTRAILDAPPAGAAAVVAALTARCAHLGPERKVAAQP